MKQIVLKTIPNDTQRAQFRSGHHPAGGYRDVRAASDIVRIATGTGMVVEAMQDWGR